MAGRRSSTVATGRTRPTWPRWPAPRSSPTRTCQGDARDARRGPPGDVAGHGGQRLSRPGRSRAPGPPASSARDRWTSAWSRAVTADRSLGQSGDPRGAGRCDPPTADLLPRAHRPILLEGRHDGDGADGQADGRAGRSAPADRPQASPTCRSRPGRSTTSPPARSTPGGFTWLSWKGSHVLERAPRQPVRARQPVRSPWAVP